MFLKLGAKKVSSFFRRERLLQTLVEKIVQRHAEDIQEGQKVEVGDFVSIRPLHVMTHDNTSAVMSKFSEFFDRDPFRFDNPAQPVFTLDHNVQDKSEPNLKKYSKIKEFAQKYSIDFYPAGRGIGHQVKLLKIDVYPLLDNIF